MSTIQGLLHPHHVSLTRRSYSLQTLLQSLTDRDPYYMNDPATSYKTVSVPRFSVTETERDYILEGELPGVADKSKIDVVWLQNHVLVIHGIIEPIDTKIATGATKTEAPATEPTETSSQPSDKPDAKATTAGQKSIFPRQLLHERHVGPFERSFTFPDEVEEDNMKASLKDGLLTVVVPKKARSTSGDKKVDVQ